MDGVEVIDLCSESQAKNGELHKGKKLKARMSGQNENQYNH